MNWKEALEDGLVTSGIVFVFLISFIAFIQRAMNPDAPAPDVSGFFILSFISLGFGALVYILIDRMADVHETLGVFFYLVGLSPLSFLTQAHGGEAEGADLAVLFAFVFTIISIPFFFLVGRALRGGLYFLEKEGKNGKTE